MSEDQTLEKILNDITDRKNYYIELFCKTFFISQEVKSLEELRALYQIAHLKIENGPNFSMSVKIEMDDFDEKCKKWEERLVKKNRLLSKKFDEKERLSNNSACPHNMFSERP